MKKFILIKFHSDGTQVFWNEKDQIFLLTQMYATLYDTEEQVRHQLYNNKNVPSGMYQILPIHKKTLTSPNE